MDKLKMMSMNKVQENIQKIRELFPNAVTEVLRDSVPTFAVDFDVLKQELANTLIDERELRYQFTWPDKQKSVLLANTPISATLRPCKEESVDFDNTQNLYIEGDNLDVLKLLQEAYLGKIKMIYIDPPYNTGNDFVYNDNFAQDSDEYAENSGQYDDQGNRLVQNAESNGRFHTDWLNMIYPRLRLAKDLLSDDGVIFISIDDNEVENLKKVCNEIFGESNFIGQWNWFKSATPPNLSYKIKKNIEYVLAYEKIKDNIRYCGLLKKSPSNDPFTKPQNAYKELRFPAGTITTTLSDGIYKAGIYGTNKFPNELRNDLIILNGRNKNDVVFYNRFIWVQETLNENLKNGLRVDLSKQLVLSYKRENYNPECPPNLIDDTVFVDTTEQAGVDLDNLFDDTHVFDYPKSVSLIKYILNFKYDKSATVLDFFSGSATTAHAVMQMNVEDGGNRKFIMVQLPENLDENLKKAANDASKKTQENAIEFCNSIGKKHYLTEIGKERIRRAGAKIKQESGLTAQNLDIGFRVLKLDSSNMKDVYYKPEQYEQSLLSSFEDNIKEDRSPLDLLFQVMLDLGKPLSAKIEEKEIVGKKVFIVDDNDLIACFDANVTDEVVKTIAQLKPLYAVFRDSSLSSDSTAANFDQIFATYSPNTTRKVL